MQSVSNYKEKSYLFNSDHFPIYVNERLAIFFSFAQFSIFWCFVTGKQANKTGCIYWDVCLVPKSGQHIQSCKASWGLALHDTAISKWSSVSSVQIQHWSYTLFHIHLGCGFLCWFEPQFLIWAHWEVVASAGFHLCWCHCAQKANNDSVWIPSPVDVMSLL